MIIMSKTIVLIALVSLAIGTNAGWLDRLKGKPENVVDFDGLDKWLVKRLSDIDHDNANIYFVKGHLDELKDKPKVRRAGEIFLNVTDGACENYLNDLTDMLGDKVNLAGERRIEKVIASKLWRINLDCGGHVDETVAKLYKSSLEKDSILEEMLKIVVRRPNDWVFLQSAAPGDGYPREHFIFCSANLRNGCKLTAKDWASHLFKLAEGDEKVRDGQGSPKSRLSSQRWLFDFAFNKYLEEPCQRLSDAAGDIFEGLYTLIGLQTTRPTEYREFMLKRETIVQRLSYSYKICKTLKGVDKKDVFAEMQFVE